MTIEEIAQSIADGGLGTENMRELAIVSMLARHYGESELSLDQVYKYIFDIREIMYNQKTNT